MAKAHASAIPWSSIFFKSLCDDRCVAIDTIWHVARLSISSVSPVPSRIAGDMFDELSEIKVDIPVR